MNRIKSMKTVSNYEVQKGCKNKEKWKKVDKFEKVVRSGINLVPKTSSLPKKSDEKREKIGSRMFITSNVKKYFFSNLSKCLRSPLP